MEPFLLKVFSVSAIQFSWRSKFFEKSVKTYMVSFCGRLARLQHLTRSTGHRGSRRHGAARSCEEYCGKLPPGSWMSLVTRARLLILVWSTSWYRLAIVSVWRWRWHVVTYTCSTSHFLSCLGWYIQRIGLYVPRMASWFPWFIQCLEVRELHLASQVRCKFKLLDHITEKYSYAVYKYKCMQVLAALMWDSNTWRWLEWILSRVSSLLSSLLYYSENISHVPLVW